MTQAQRSQYQPSIADSGIKRPTFIRKQLQLCSTGLNSLAELYDGLRVTGALVEQRELPAGARERFFEAVARSASTRPKEATVKVASIASSQERRIIAKRSLLPVNRQTPEIPGRAGNSKSSFKTAVVATTNAVAARIAGIF